VTHSFALAKQALADAFGRDRCATYARALGASDEDLRTLFAEVEAERRESTCDFDRNAEVQRRLMETYAAQLPRPSVEARAAARLLLLSRNEPDHPALVDWYARAIEVIPRRSE
jgi:hypothetical protein